MLDVESFLQKTLEEEQLSEAASSEKDAILTKLKALQDDYPQLRRFEADFNRERERTTTTLTDSPRLQSKQSTCSDDSGSNECF